MTSVAIYVRLSDEDRDKRYKEDESESIQNQRSLLCRYCEERNWDIYDIYCDENYSGTDFDRPDFQRMLHDCEAGRVNIVLSKSQSRFSRDAEVVEHFLHNKFLEWGIRFIGLVDNADTDVEGNKRSRQISGLINEWYCEETSKNVRRILQHKRETGQFTGSFAAYGYLVDPADKHHLIPDPETAPVVRDIYERYLSGQGYKKIASALNEAGIPNPTEYKHRSDSRYVNKNADRSPDSGLWTLSTIAAVLHNEVYMGTLAQGRSHNVSYKNHRRKKVPKEDWIRTYNAHEAVVDEATWYAVRDMLNSKTHRGSRVTGEIPVLSGKVKCAVCGRPMKRNTYANKAHTTRYYNLRCASYQKGTNVCENSSCISGIELEQQLVEAINAHIVEYCDTDELILTDKYTEQLEACRKTVSRIDSDIARKQLHLSRAYEDKLEGRIDETEYNAHSAKFRADIAGLGEEREKLNSRIELLKTEIEKSDSKAEAISRYCHIDKLDNSVVNEFINNIYVGTKQPDGSREIRIEWNF